MIRTSASLFASFILVLVASSSACVSFAQPHAFDVGRGAEPMKPGTMQAHGAVWGGAMPTTFPASVQGGAGVEGQLSNDLAVGFDVGTGVEGTAIKGTAMPTSGI